jgi:acetyl esterase/lipase
LPDESPIFVYFSGGYWQLLCGEMSAYVVEPMYHAKIVTIVVDYARAPGGN